MGNEGKINSLWHDAEKEMPKDGTKVLIYSLGSNFYLCDVRNGNVVGIGGYIWNREIKCWLDINDLIQDSVSDNLQDAADNKAQEAYPVRTKTNKTGTGDYDPNLPRRKAYVKGFVDGYNFRTNKVEDNDTNT